MSLDREIGRRLAALAADGLLRDPADASARDHIAEVAGRLGLAPLDVTSNDYLGLAELPDVSRETAWGAGASRLVQGTRPAHEELERALADWVGLPAALLFSSGYAANVGVVPALAGPGALVFSDALNHASLVDGCRLSKATVRIIPHLDLDTLERALADGADGAERWVLTESYFSMDGDGPDLARLRAVCDRHGAFLMVDEAHALGVFGPEGAGRCVEAGIRPDVLVGTFGKAAGVQGAFVAGSPALRTWLWNRARSFVFSTAPSPALCAVTLERVRRARGAGRERAELHALASELRERLRRAGVPMVEGSFGPILAVIAGSSSRAMALAEALRENAILAQAIRPPTVPANAARLRVTLNAKLTRADVERLALALEAACVA